MRYLFIVLMQLWGLSISAQNEDPTTPGILAFDSTDTDIDTVIERRNGILDVFEGNPGKAAFRGLIIPAGGQIYNRRWWKVPIALGIEGGTIGYLVFAYQKFDDADILFRQALEDNSTDAAILLKNRNAWRSRRELAWVFWAASHIFVAFEAYIDRHLIEFDVSDDLTFVPTQSFLGPIANITYTIPLHTQRYQKTPTFSISP